MQSIPAMRCSVTRVCRYFQAEDGRFVNQFRLSGLDCRRALREAQREGGRVSSLRFRSCENKSDFVFFFFEEKSSWKHTACSIMQEICSQIQTGFLPRRVPHPPAFRHQQTKPDFWLVIILGLPCFYFFQLYFFGAFLPR